jgi:hypothetical protein
VVVGVVVVVAGRLTGVVGVVRRRGGVVVDVGLFAGLVAGRPVLPPIMPPPVTPPGSCCASATLLVVINRTADRQSTRGAGDMTFSPAFNSEIGERRIRIIVKNERAWERLFCGVFCCV